MSENISSGIPAIRSDALKQLYNTCYSPVENYVTARHGDVEDAKDIFQEGVIAFFQSLKKGTFRGDSSHQTYLMAICKRRWLDVLRGRKILVNYEEIQVFREEEVVFSPDEKKLKSVLGLLKESCRTILLAFYYESKSMKDIQTLFSLGSEQAAKNKKMRCLNELMAIVKSRRLNRDDFKL